MISNRGGSRVCRRSWGYLANQKWLEVEVEGRKLKQAKPNRLDNISNRGWLYDFLRFGFRWLCHAVQSWVLAYKRNCGGADWCCCFGGRAGIELPWIWYRLRWRNGRLSMSGGSKWTILFEEMKTGLDSWYNLEKFQIHQDSFKLHVNNAHSKNRENHQNVQGCNKLFSRRSPCLTAPLSPPLPGNFSHHCDVLSSKIGHFLRNFKPVVKPRDFITAEPLPGKW